MRILAFSSRLGQFTPILLSSMNPERTGIRCATRCDTMHTFIQIRIFELSTNLFDYLDVFEICRTLIAIQEIVHLYTMDTNLESQNCIDSKVCKVVFVLGKDFGRKSCSSDVE